MSEKESIRVYLPKELVEKLDKIAQEQFTRRQDIIWRAVYYWIANYEKETEGE